MDGTIQLVSYPTERVKLLIPYPSLDANKYTRGHLVVIGGAPDYPGAVALSSSAALRMGAGYVESLCSADARCVVQTLNPNVVARKWCDISPVLSKLQTSNVTHPCACLVGVGLIPDDDKTKLLTLDVLNEVSCPVLVDAGAISIVATKDGMNAASARQKRGFATVLTPHLGEAKRLAKLLSLDTKSLTSEQGHAEFAKALACAYGATVVLKGPDTYIATCDNSGDVYVMKDGTPALAKAGTGDVLAGMIVSLLAQGLTALDACNIGAVIHAQTAKFASSNLNPISVCASDLVKFLPKAIDFFM